MVEWIVTVIVVTSRSCQSSTTATCTLSFVQISTKLEGLLRVKADELRLHDYSEAVRTLHLVGQLASGGPDVSFV